MVLSRISRWNRSQELEKPGVQEFRSSGVQEGPTSILEFLSFRVLELDVPLRSGAMRRCRLLSAQSHGSLAPMGLIFQLDEKGQARPKIQCDGCGGVIENPSGCVASWENQSAQPGTVVNPTFECQHCKSKGGGARNAVPLDSFMLYLMNNMNFTPGALEEAGRRLRGMAD